MGERDPEVTPDWVATFALIVIGFVMAAIVIIAIAVPLRG